MHTRAEDEGRVSGHNYGTRPLRHRKRLLPGSGTDPSPDQRSGMATVADVP